MKNILCIGRLYIRCIFVSLSNTLSQLRALIVIYLYGTEQCQIWTPQQSMAVCCAKSAETQGTIYSTSSRGMLCRYTLSRFTSMNILWQQSLSGFWQWEEAWCSRARTFKIFFFSVAFEGRRQIQRTSAIPNALACFVPVQVTGIYKKTQ